MSTRDFDSKIQGYTYILNHLNDDSSNGNRGMPMFIHKYYILIVLCTCGDNMKGMIKQDSVEVYREKDRKMIVKIEYDSDGLVCTYSYALIRSDMIGKGD